jgi:hypothetical protein
MDSQLVPTAVMVHESVGYDTASVPERAGAKQLLSKVNQDRERFPRLARIWVDGGFLGEALCDGSSTPSAGF